MLKKIVQRAITGFAATVLTQLVIVLLITQAGGSAVTAAFAAHFANETAATLAQTLLCSLIGMAFSCGSVVFEIERWSYLLQGAVHFAITAAVWAPIAWVCWRPNSLMTALYAGLGWLLTYAINWLIQYGIYRRSLMKLNARIESFGREVEIDARKCD